jgi:hypothetical protein
VFLNYNFAFSGISPNNIRDGYSQMAPAHTSGMTNSEEEFEELLCSILQSHDIEFERQCELGRKERFPRVIADLYIPDTETAIELKVDSGSSHLYRGIGQSLAYIETNNIADSQPVSESLLLALDGEGSELNRFVSGIVSDLDDVFYAAGRPLPNSGRVIVEGWESPSLFNHYPELFVV